MAAPGVRGGVNVGERNTKILEYETSILGFITVGGVIDHPADCNKPHDLNGSDYRQPVSMSS